MHSCAIIPDRGTRRSKKVWLLSDDGSDIHCIRPNDVPDDHPDGRKVPAEFRPCLAVRNPPRCPAMKFSFYRNRGKFPAFRDCPSLALPWVARPTISRNCARKAAEREFRCSRPPSFPVSCPYYLLPSEAHVKAGFFALQGTQSRRAVVREGSRWATSIERIRLFPVRAEYRRHPQPRTERAGNQRM